MGNRLKNHEIKTTKATSNLVASRDSRTSNHPSDKISQRSKTKKFVKIWKISPWSPLVYFLKIFRKIIFREISSEGLFEVVKLHLRVRFVLAPTVDFLSIFRLHTHTNCVGAHNIFEEKNHRRKTAIATSNLVALRDSTTSNYLSDKIS